MTTYSHQDLRAVLDAHARWLRGGSGGPRADRFAAQAAEYLGIPVTEYAADWSQGRKAGPMRNRRMLDDFKPTLVLAFPGGRGTADCIRAARERGIRVVEVPPDA